MAPIFLLFQADNPLIIQIVARNATPLNNRELNRDEPGAVPIFRRVIIKTAFAAFALAEAPVLRETAETVDARILLSRQSSCLRERQFWVAF